LFNQLIDIMQGRGNILDLVVYIFATLLIIFLVLPFHEWAHAFAASKLGDTSIKYRGRLSLNPMSHIDYMGALFLLLFGFGWAKPVPVDDRKFKNPKVGMAITALAGPLANIVAAMVGGLVFFAILTFAPQFVLSKLGYYVMMTLEYYMVINCSLAVFNLIPWPPLDGSKILFAFLPDKWIYKFYQYQQIFFFALMAMLLFTNILDAPLNFLFSNVYQFVLNICSYPFQLFV